jgi:hypothetical protein
MTMRTITLRRLGLVIAIGAAVLVGAAAPAAAATEDTVDGLKTAVSHRIDLRLVALNKDLTVVNDAQALTATHKSLLTTIITNDQSALTALKTKVAGETTLAALRADATSMVDDYRVFILVGPQVRLSVAGDVGDRAVGKAQQAHDKLATLVAAKKAQGKDTTQAEADLAAMQAAIDSAKSHLAGQVDTLLGIKPGPDGTAIRAAVSAVRSAIGAARADLLTAAAKGKAVIAFLKAN